MIDGGAESNLLENLYRELSEAYNAVEKAHEDLCLVLEEDHEDAADSYLDDPSSTLASMHVSVSKAVAANKEKVATANEVKEKEAQFQGSLAALKANIKSFGSPATNLTRLTTEKVISCADMRIELSKIEATYSKLMDEKTKLINLNPTADLTAVNEQFNSRIVDEVDRCKRVALEYVKDDVAVAPVAVDTGGGMSVRRTSFSTTKRETVMLPQFSGDEKTAFLRYPVWKLQWDSHILEYEE